MSSTAEIERDIEETRARLDETIERIQDKLTVTGLVDEALGAVGVPRYGDKADFMMGLLRRHPVTVMIAAAALGIVVHRMNRRRAPLLIEARPGLRSMGEPDPGVFGDVEPMAPVRSASSAPRPAGRSPSDTMARAEAGT